jgi:hypothetical protein
MANSNPLWSSILFPLLSFANNFSATKRSVSKLHTVEQNKKVLDKAKEYRVGDEGLEGGERAANGVHELDPLTGRRRRRAEQGRFDCR